MNPPTTDAFITWANSYINAPDRGYWIQLQRQRFNSETWHSLSGRLTRYLLTQ